MATALAASSTCSRSFGVTSRSRIAAVPCELRVSRCEPEIEAYTERMSQPAISSASSIARWIECTVDSMSTTAPFFMPREMCEPNPITSTGSPGRYSPTTATTFEVPISRPTTRCLSLLRFMGLNVSGRSMGFQARCGFGIGCGLRRCGCFRPLHREAVAVTEVGIHEPAGPAAQELRHHRNETSQPLPGGIAPDDNRGAVGERELPAATLGQFHARHRQMERREVPLRLLIKREHVGDAIIRPRQMRQVRHGVRTGHHEQPVAFTEQAPLAPVRDRMQFT